MQAKHDILWQGGTVISQIIRYYCELSHDEVNQRFIDRAHGYRKVLGLLQKYYVKFTEMQEHGGNPCVGLTGVS